ncbi:hypothetical protein CFR74_00495 [Novacetimonas hansenii]|nr:hypothetical protein CFR74_00495 [Novacetimonas hansenii]
MNGNYGRHRHKIGTIIHLYNACPSDQPINMSAHHASIAIMAYQVRSDPENRAECMTKHVSSPYGCIPD